MMHRVEHVVMIVPVDRDEHEAQDVGQKDRPDGRQPSGLHAMRHLQLENHDRDDDREDAVGEGFEASLAHTPNTTYFRRYRVVDRESALMDPRESWPQRESRILPRFAASSFLAASAPLTRAGSSGLPLCRPSAARGLSGRRR